MRTRRGALYTGIATDVTRRYAEHLAGGARAARYLRGDPPVGLAFHAAIGNRALALRAEARVKRLSKAAKEALVLAQPGQASLLASLSLAPG